MTTPNDWCSRMLVFLSIVALAVAALTAGVVVFAFFAAGCLLGSLTAS